MVSIQEWFVIKIWHLYGKVGKILEGSLDSNPSPSPSLKGGKVCLRCKDKTLLGVVNKIKSLLTMPSNGLPLHLKQTFPPIFLRPCIYIIAKFQIRARRYFFCTPIIFLINFINKKVGNRKN
jgi:hypothetical protein